MIDLESIKLQADLLALAGHDTQLKKVSTSGGGEYAGSCPFCGGKDRFRVQPQANPARWLCRHCTNSKWQDVISYIARRDNLDPKKGADLAEICKRATGGQLPTTSQPINRQTITQLAYSPMQDQAAANQVIDICAARLWKPEGKAALDYLMARGLRDETIKYFRLGYCQAKTDIAGLTIYQGITIPGIIAGEVWYIKIRVSQALVKKGWSKYLGIKGSKPAAIYNADNLAGADLALFCEGEFDCMIAHQELNQYLPAVSLGSADNTPDLATWGAYLIPLKVILSCYDNDQAGSNGAARLAELAGDRVKLAPLPPGQKDINDYYKTGADLFDWIKPYIDTYYFDGKLETLGSPTNNLEQNNRE